MFNPVIDYLKLAGHGNLSFISTIQTLSGQNKSKEYYLDSIKTLTGNAPAADQVKDLTRHGAKIWFLYIIQEGLKTSAYNGNEIYDKSLSSMESFYKEYKWSIVESEELSSSLYAEISQLYETLRQKMTRPELIEHISMICDIKPATLASYISTLSKEIGSYKKDTTVAIKQSSKKPLREIANDVYIELGDQFNRDKFIKMMQERGSKKSSATTLYYIICKDYQIQRDDAIRNGNKKPTKASKAKIIVESNPQLSKDELIELIRTEVSTSKAGANTYYHLAIKDIT